MCTTIILIMCFLVVLLRYDPKWRINLALMALLLMAWGAYFAFARARPVLHTLEGVSVLIALGWIWRIVYLRKQGLTRPFEFFIARLGAAKWAVVKHPVVIGLAVLLAALIVVDVASSVDVRLSWQIVVGTLLVGLIALRIPTGIKRWRQFDAGACPFGFKGKRIAGIEHPVPLASHLAAK